jgi:hypothetical protein
LRFSDFETLDFSPLCHFSHFGFFTILVSCRRVSPTFGSRRLRARREALGSPASIQMACNASSYHSRPPFFWWGLPTGKRAAPKRETLFRFWPSGMLRGP